MERHELVLLVREGRTLRLNRCLVLNIGNFWIKFLDGKPFMT